MTGFRSAYLRIALLVVLSCAAFATTAIQTSHVAMAFEIDDDGHEGITRDALKGIFRTLPSGAGAVQFSEKALEEIADANEDIDNYQTSPAMHFDGERFVEGANRLYVLRENVIKALAKDVPDGKTAREELGHALHTLQDFYAHSNWVDLQKQGVPLPKPAGLSRTELDSTKVFSHKAFCPIASDELDLTVPALTSGYFGWTPAGKCDHGFDQLRIKNGGIAKDTLWLSQPDKSLHQVAKDAAKTATTDFVNGILDDGRIKDNFKAIRALMGATAPLIFVIDDSGSMAGEILEVKARVALLVIQARVMDYPPQEYILVRFNDPQVGPMLITSDPDEFLSAVNAISVGDGGDCPELYYEAIQFALEASSPGAVIYSFTDASAKDVALKGTTEAMAKAREVAINAVKTGSCFAAATAEEAESRMPKQEMRPSQIELMADPGQGFAKFSEIPSFAEAVDADPDFAEITRETGGVLFNVSPSDVDKVFDAIESRVLKSAVPMLIRSGALSSTPVEIGIPIDSSVSQASIVVSINGSAPAPILRNPSGVAVTTSTPNVKIQTLGYNRIFTLDAPASGAWILQLSGSGSHNVQVAVSSDLQFSSFEFVEPVERPHADFGRIPGQPLTGGSYEAQARIIGSPASATFQLIGDDGSVLQTPALTEVGANKLYTGTITPPAQAFRMQVSGTTSSGQPYQRLFPALFSTKSVNVQPDWVSYAHTLIERPVLSGQAVPLTFTVQNLGASGVFSISAGVGDAQILAVKPPSLTLASGLSQTVVVTVGIAPTRVDKDIAVSVVAANMADSSVYNTSVVNLFVPGANLMQIPMVSKPAEPVPFNWLEATTGGRVVAAGDDTYERVDLPFPFTYFGQTYSQIFVASNGFITFGAGANSRYPVCAPSRNLPNNAVYAFWSDLIPTGGANGNVYVRQADPQTVVVQWNRVKHYFRQTLQTFQIILRADSSITLQYKSVDPSAQGIVGFEDSLGLTGSSIVCPGRNASPANNSAYRFAVR